MTTAYQFYRRLLESGPQGIVEKALFPFFVASSGLYTIATALRLAAYDRGLFKTYRAAVPVISVGNLTVGGTGKTPVVDELARRGLAAGKRLAIVSRGYGGQRKAATALVSDGGTTLNDDPVLYGDEPVLLARRNPDALVIVARRRSEGVRLAEEMGADLIVLDDAFQHLRVVRDLDIVLLDSKQPFGNHRLLPAGPLREPVSGLQRADLLIFTRFRGEVPLEGEFSQPYLTCRQTLADSLVSLDGETCDWADLAGKRCVAFAGIASPQSFFAALRERGMSLVAEIALQDHQEFDQAVLRRIAKACRDADFCLTTEKDAVKLTQSVLPVACWSVPLQVSLQPEHRLQKILGKFFC